MRVGIIDHMDCAHALPGIDGGEGVHGHTYKVEVVVQGDYKGGMLIDFKALREQARQAMAAFDHRNLNEVLSFPSVENLCLAIFHDLAARQPGLVSVRLWEGATKWAEVNLDDPSPRKEPPRVVRP